ncbi:3-oxoadipate enol-lactonase [Burkholderia sp. WAC0059]|uniref:3-oxoadipate enol-lactonase n=1 Tax=Burkholderia sp. WAC0059 TaxID=2066022 RepID=UPI000C7E91F8|nr:3-oxoadipate enol-lactonase [Burkholderia sp. WAC0059]PLZ03183.1 3-oxoadipate enol-lactonase [Burkholderia sp. WAC0059]
MPFVSLPDGQLHYRIDGRDDAPVLVLSNSLGTNLGLWDFQIDAFAEHFRVVRYDTRGHGRSLVTPGPYSMEQNSLDLLALLDTLAIRKFFFLGLSMGGSIGQWLAINAGERLHKLVLCNTGAKIGTDESWPPRIAAVRQGGKPGMLEMREATIRRWFTPDFVTANPSAVEHIARMLADSDPEGYAANCEALRDADTRAQVSAITVPTLIVGGTYDVATTMADAKFLHDNIAGSELAEFPAAHLSNVQFPDDFNRRVLKFLVE